MEEKGVKGEKGPVEGTIGRNQAMNRSMVEGLKWDRQRQGLQHGLAKAQSVVAWSTGISACKSDWVEFFFFFFFLAFPLQSHSNHHVPEDLVCERRRYPQVAWRGSF